MKLKAQEGGEGKAHRLPGQAACSKDILGGTAPAGPCRTQYTEVVSLDP